MTGCWFNYRAQVTDHLFLGMVQDTSDDLIVNFPKFTPTKIASGQIFTWLDEDDTSVIEPQQIIGKVKDPILQRRGKILFDVDANQWY